ncbi:hypothetical protein CORC01_00963 [Colletotrichum orchidophilum]|uniref:Clr5 domain-containing protein n=1 Tax=Colletotrichum orchidophilum TaxID=1209926 RepID=A0A1G4BQC3_9PEZI|nr:uncharacterized protein CORC01_00963 [Colletotrichum orchidophilum]OHF03644.1 hypothetical protein CORC01_00963 [Colletotrichum orchidophilum]
MDWTPNNSVQTFPLCDEPQEFHDAATEYNDQSFENQLNQYHPRNMFPLDLALTVPSQDDPGFHESLLQPGDCNMGDFPVIFEQSINQMCPPNMDFQNTIDHSGLSHLNANGWDPGSSDITPQHQNTWYYSGEPSEMIPQERQVGDVSFMIQTNDFDVNVEPRDSGWLSATPNQSLIWDTTVSSSGAPSLFRATPYSRQMSSNEMAVMCDDQSSAGPSTTQSAIQLPTTRKAIRSAKKSTYSDGKWDELRKDHLNRLYIQENHTLDEVVFELAVIHNIEIGYIYHVKLIPLDEEFLTRLRKSTIERRLKKWSEFSKNNARQLSQQNISTRRRPASALTFVKSNSTSSIGQYPFASLNQARRQAEVDRIRDLSPATYLHQEKMFHALDQLVKGLLASGKKSWRVYPVRPISFMADGGDEAARGKSSQDWESLIEKCRGMATLADSSQFGEVRSVFGNVLASTKRIVQTCTPDFLVSFWKVCIALFQVRIGGRRDYLCLRLFLHNLGAQLVRSPSVGGHHAVTTFVSSLIGVIESEPLDLKVTLGLAYWKAIHVLASILGGDHAIVLNMTTHCIRHWSGRFTPQRHVLESAYEGLLSRESPVSPALSQRDISLRLDLLYAVSMRKNYSPDVFRRADDLWSMTRDISLGKATTGRLRPTVITRAFDFTTELLTAHHLEAASNARESDAVEASQAMVFGCLDTAVEILRKGSLECQIRAVAFSKRLEVHLRASGRKTQAVAERDRGRDLRLGIKRVVMAPSWVPSFEPTMRKTTSRRRAPTKAAWAAEKRRLRIKSRDNLVCMLQIEGHTQISA